MSLKMASHLEVSEFRRLLPVVKVLNQNTSENRSYLHHCKQCRYTCHGCSVLVGLASVLVGLAGIYKRLSLSLKT